MHDWLSVMDGSIPLRQMKVGNTLIELFVNNTVILS